MAVEQTLVLIKPDGLVKSLTGNIITTLSETELKIVGAKVVQVTRELAEEHYCHLKEEKFFDLFREMTQHIVQGAQLLKDMIDNAENPAKYCTNKR